ncbi:uncharacterized protein EV154DRAFT_481106 [Mucor mucedo]|uniref:uncharacterized protein n=1 Tax=Mucor mucedo TaxID=29922 RepID=UPI002220B7D7|nr:uncharacterized protein EV154DRAFT_481106 [Mucor mucedo]KAI7891679.1 hypothetical protein EV154DRAFT_481106 [Mucor mucedo]
MFSYHGWKRGSILSFVGNWSGKGSYTRGHTRRNTKLILNRFNSVTVNHVAVVDKFKRLSPTRRTTVNRDINGVTNIALIGCSCVVSESSFEEILLTQTSTTCHTIINATLESPVASET